MQEINLHTKLRLLHKTPITLSPIGEREAATRRETGHLVLPNKHRLAAISRLFCRLGCFPFRSTPSPTPESSWAGRAGSGQVGPRGPGRAAPGRGESTDRASLSVPLAWRSDSAPRPFHKHLHPVAGAGPQLGPRCTEWRHPGGPPRRSAQHSEHVRRPGRRLDPQTTRPNSLSQPIGPGRERQTSHRSLITVQLLRSEPNIAVNSTSSRGPA